MAFIGLVTNYHRDELRSFQIQNEALDLLHFHYLLKPSLRLLCELTKQLPILSHGQSGVEWGFQSVRNGNCKVYDGKLLGDKKSLIAGLMGPTWDPSGADRTQVSPMSAPWTWLSGVYLATWNFISWSGKSHGMSFNHECASAYFTGCWYAHTHTSIHTALSIELDLIYWNLTTHT